MNEKNLSMMMDLYEMTMANGFYLADKTAALKRKAVFDVFYRKNPDDGGFAIYAGLEQVLQYIKEFSFSESDIEYLRKLGTFSKEFLDFLAENANSFDVKVSGLKEGSVIYPNEPVLTVTAPILWAQLLETEILTQINHQALIATKANRIVTAADGRVVSDFGARRAHNNDAAVFGARAAYIGGVNGTATVLAGKEFGIPVSGTMAHSWVMFYESEYEAFKKFAEIYPDNLCLLIDTYDTLKSGLPNAIRVFKETIAKLGRKPKFFGIRIDSGDLAYLSKEVRLALDKAELHDAKIVISNSLDEYTIQSLLDQGAKIDSFGVGERLITSKSDPVFGAVYKLAAIIDEDNKVTPKIKVSNNVEKITNPGIKYVYRLYNISGKSIGDVISDAAEFDENAEYINPKRPWKRIKFDNIFVELLTQDLFERKDGKIILHEEKSLADIRDFVRYSIERTWGEETRFSNPHEHAIYMPVSYYQKKMDMLSEKKVK